MSVVSLAIQQVGYQSPNGYNKFAEQLDAVDYFNGKKNGYNWCAIFVNWLFFKQYGKSLALKMLYEPTSNNYAAGCTEGFNYFRQNGAAFNYPQVGDQIFFGTVGNCYHTGLVVQVTQDKVYTVEGNTRPSDNTVQATGNGVWQKVYDINNSGIAGYGRPNWALAPTPTPPSPDPTPDPEPTPPEPVIPTYEPVTAEGGNGGLGNKDRPYMRFGNGGEGGHITSTIFNKNDYKPSRQGKDGQDGAVIITYIG